MLVDARSVEPNAAIETDVCIIGAGAAGIAIARELSGTPISVCLLESGGFSPDPDTQTLYEGTSTGTFLGTDDPYLLRSRLRYFGGTTNHWSGWCRPLDPIDFEERSWVPHSGWPFARTHLDPYYRRAVSLIQIQPFDYELTDSVTGPLRPLLLPQNDRIVTKAFHYSPPTRFGREYRAEIVNAPNVTLYLHANVLELHADDAASTVEYVDVACMNGNQFTLKARHFILATGGVENARLLLLSNSVEKTGLGNRNDLVGRFFADHPHLDAGYLALSDVGRPMQLYYFYDDPRLGHPALGVLTVDEEAQRRKQLLNLRVHLRPASPGELPDLGRAVGRSAASLDSLARGQRERRHSVMGGYWDLNEPRYYALEVSCETMPNRNSRLTLTREVDALGKQQVALDWQVDSLSSASIREAILILGTDLGKRFRGRAHVLLDDTDPWPGAWGGNHHMGTTRMHPDPRQGVVDADCRVHGVSNLFVAGSSVFPTYGFANPTLTLLALALRLSDRLKNIYRA